MLWSFINGVCLGSVVGIAFCNWTWKGLIKDKAKSHISLCIKGKYYTIREDKFINKIYDTKSDW